MAYTAVSVVVEGAVDDDRTFLDDDPGAFDVFIDKLRGEQAENGLNYAVYVLHHDHDEDIECSCIEYLQDHRPTYQFTNQGSEHANA